MTVFNGQTENAGHFLQPTIRAIGHTVIELVLYRVFARRDFGLKLDRHHNRASARPQNSDPKQSENVRFPAARILPIWTGPPETDHGCRFRCYRGSLVRETVGPVEKVALVI